jgi:hypothetical protein
METKSVDLVERSLTQAGEVATADYVHPLQFDDIWSCSRARTSEQRLALAVLERAILDLLKYRYARRRRQQRIYREAYEWVAADDHTWMYSFVNICSLLHLSSERLRQEFLEPAGRSLGERLQAA